MIDSASKRTGLNGVPDMEADQSRSEMGCAVHSVLRDSSVLKSSKEHPPRIEKRYETFLSQFEVPFSE